MKRTEKLVIIKPKYAGSLLKFNNFVGQRNIRENHAVQLSQKMQDGRFHVGNIALVHQNGDTLLADGQHQLTASVLAKVPFKAVLQEYHLNGEDDPNQLATVFSQFNVDCVRGRGDIAWIYACQLGWSDWNRRVVTLLATALSLLHNVESHGEMRYYSEKLTKDQSASLLVENQKVCQWVNSLDVASHRHMKRAPAIAAMIATYRKAQKASDEFWRAVTAGEMLKASDPQYRLREFLSNACLKHRSPSEAEKEQTTLRAVYAKSITAWNAWREGRTTSLKYYAKAQLPKPV